MTVCFTTVVIMRFAFRCVVASFLGTTPPSAVAQGLWRDMMARHGGLHGSRC